MKQPSTTTREQGFVRGLNLFDATMVVIGAMIGSGIFIVSADMSRLIGSPGWMLVAWAVTGVLTIAAALSYGELASMLPDAGGMYVYLREAFSPLWGFLYGWTLFTVIQTGTIAAVAVAFARFLAVVFPPVSESRYLVEPIHISSRYAISLSVRWTSCASSWQACRAGGHESKSVSMCCLSSTAAACSLQSSSCHWRGVATPSYGRSSWSRNATSLGDCRRPRP